MPSSPFCEINDALEQALLDWGADIVHFHCVHIPLHARIARKLKKTGAPCCVTINGALTGPSLHRRWLAKKAFHFFFERRYLEQAAFIHCVSKVDLQGLEQYGARNRIVFAPNCIDLSTIPENIDGTFVQRRYPAFDGTILGFSGQLDPDERGSICCWKPWPCLTAMRKCRSRQSAGPDWRSRWTPLRGMAEMSGNAISLALWPGVNCGQIQFLTFHRCLLHPSRWEEHSWTHHHHRAAASRSRASSPRVLRSGWINRQERVESGTSHSIAGGIRTVARMTHAERLAMGKAARNRSKITLARNAQP